jgi:hypothetical protein
MPGRVVCDMPTITLSDSAHAALRSISENWHETGIQRTDGSWTISLDQKMIARLNDIRMSGENFSDVVERLVAFKRANGRLG